LRRFLGERKSKLSHEEKELNQTKSQDEAHLNFLQPNHLNLPELSVNMRHLKEEASLLSVMKSKRKDRCKTSHPSQA